MSPANTQQLQSLGILIKRGLDKGFNAHHVVQQLEHNGYSRTDLLKALQIVEHPELLEQEEAEQRERQIALQEKKAEMEQLREQHPFDKHVTDRKETKRREELFH